MLNLYFDHKWNSVKHRIWQVIQITHEIDLTFSEYGGSSQKLLTQASLNVVKIYSLQK